MTGQKTVRSFFMILNSKKNRIITGFLGYDAVLYVVEITGIEPVTS